MDWTQFEVDRFVKIMTLALSGPSPEAQVALQKAADMLRQAGGNFESIADALRTGAAMQGEGGGTFAKKSATGHETSSPVAENGKRPVPGQDMTMSQLLERLARVEFRNRTLERDNEISKTQLDEAVRYIIKLEDDLARITGPSRPSTEKGKSG